MKRSILKRSLLLSAASVALAWAPAMADNLDITSSTSTAVKTSSASNSTPGDITIESNGSITIKAAGPAVTLDSSNNVSALGAISNKDTTGAQGIVIDTGSAATPATITGLLSSTAGTMDLTGSGTGKAGIQVKGNGTFAGNIALTTSTYTIQGDSSSALQTLAGSTVNGNIEIGGSYTLTPSNTNETTATSIVGVNLGGALTGNVTFDAGTAFAAYGQGTKGFLSTGTIGGSFTNYGTIATTGFQSVVNQSTGVYSQPPDTGGPVAGSAVSIGNSILGGFLNAGSDGATTTVASATISMAGGIGITSPALFISPSLQTTPATLEIGVYTPDTANAGYSFYNRGAITATTANLNLSVYSVVIGGVGASVQAKLDGLGILNSGSITAAGSTNTKSTAAITAQALTIGSYAQIGDASNAASGLYNTNAAGSGLISASVSGALGGVATAVQIGANSTLNSITNEGTILATATTTNPDTVTTEAAYAINDQSGTLSTITNRGTIQATATQIKTGTAVQVAAFLSNNTTGVTFLDGDATHGALVSGDIMFGQGTDTLTVTGAADAQSRIVGDINFGGVNSALGGFDTLTVNDNGVVAGQIREAFAGQLNVDVNGGGSLNVLNNSAAYNTLLVNDLHVHANGTLNVAVSTVLTNNTSISAGGFGSITLDPGAVVGVLYSSFIPSTGQFVLMQTAPGNLNVSDSEFAQIKSNIDAGIPFLFDNTGGLSRVTTATADQLVLSLVPKTAAQLGLTGYAAEVFPYANAALENDDQLGAGMLTGVTDTATAQAAYSQFAPDASGGTRAIAISLTDQATGPVAARQRALRLYATQPGDLTLWGQEFAQQISDKGNNGLPGFKDSGFGFALGADGGDALGGWYGGAFTFYTGNVDQRAPASSRNNTQWYLLSGYSTWRGKGLFLDTQITAGYGDLAEHRFITIGGVTRQANSKRASIMGAAGLTTGANLVYGSTTITPNIALDGLTMRDEGYTETGGGGTSGDGFDLHVNPVLMSSLRGFAGLNLRQDVNLGSFFMQPELRVGYRYDFLAKRIDLTASFPGVTGTGPGTGDFTVTGPSPTRGNLLAGASIAATTGAWSLGINYDMLSGSNGSMTQVGTLTLVGRI